MTPHKVIELVRSTADPAFAVDVEGYIVAWNAAAAAGFGHEEQEALGRRCGDILCGIDECGPVCSVDCTVRQSAQSGRPVRNFDLHIVTPAGRQWFNISVLTYVDGGAHAAYSIHVARPVDTRKRLEMLLRDFVRVERNGSELLNASINRASIANASLSDREIDVLRLIAQGLTTDETAKHLGISRTTVNNHVQHAMSKLNAHTRLEAIRKAEFAGIL